MCRISRARCIIKDIQRFVNCIFALFLKFFPCFRARTAHTSCGREENGSAAFFPAPACRRERICVHRASLARAVAREHVSLRRAVHGADRDAQRVGAGAGADGADAARRLRDHGVGAAVRLPVQPELCRLGLPGAAAQLPRADLPAVFLRLARHRAAGGLSGRRCAVSGLRRGDRAVLLILIPQRLRRGRVR